MATRNQDDTKDMSTEEKESYCKWCWDHDYGWCDKCALDPQKRIKPEEKCRE